MGTIWEQILYLRHNKIIQPMKATADRRPCPKERTPALRDKKAEQDDRPGKAGA